MPLPADRAVPCNSEDGCTTVMWYKERPMMRPMAWSYEPRRKVQLVSGAVELKPWLVEIHDAPGELMLSQVEISSRLLNVVIPCLL